MKRILGIGICLFAFLVTYGQSKRQMEREAKKVIERFSEGVVPFHVDLSLQKDIYEHDCYATEVRDGKLRISGSNGVALCHAFYQYVKSKGCGINSWSGNRIVKPQMTDQSLQMVVSPYRDHYYLNVVTYGYTMPFWNKERWDQELDWMALHGMDMPLMLVGNEAIMRRALKRVGLTDQELDDYFVGPAHLPWMRMGNISGASFDGSLASSWHKGQLQLAHHILKRMRLLGMKPICPAFGGFVPQAIKKHYPSLKLDETSWSGKYHNWRIDPDEDLFHLIGTYFIEEWEKEFGPCKYYLSDSFNEMDIPKDLEKLATYGEKIYKSISDVNPDAVWVMQGWMLGYQRDNWNDKTLSALLKRVPDDKMMILDMATDYNKHFWYNGYDWDHFKGFYNKEWVWSVIPNMGGKTPPTGVLEYYANGRLDALQSPNKGHLTGYGFAPEGIENNEIIYELLSDGGWTDKRIDLDRWIENYALCRYGAYNDRLKSYFNKLRKSVYGSFSDHPRYAWQFRPSPTNRASVHISPVLFQAIDDFMLNASWAKDNKLFAFDMIDVVSVYVSSKIDQQLMVIERLLYANNKAEARKQIAVFRELMMRLDALLTMHPTCQLEQWERMARKWGDNDQHLSQKYARSARRIVSIWEPKDAVSVRDYAAKVWSGLIRDYYLPRWEIYFNNRLDSNNRSITAFENEWVNEMPSLTKPLSVDLIMDACVDLYHYAKDVVPAK